MNKHIENIVESTEELRQTILNHPVYAAIQDIEDLQIFMQYHIYAVWDFMSLLKALQNNLTCTSIPWFPVGDGETRHLINEIVVGEESDVDLQGIRKSHFELYVDAMNQCGASTDEIHTFLKKLKESRDLGTAFTAANTPEAAQNFVNFTFDTINSNKSYLQAAIFTFGREDLIPGMFVSMINDIYKSTPEKISIFHYYLERHIEIDGDHHSHLALQMTENLCGDNETHWIEALDATKKSLQQRIALWNGALQAIQMRKQHVLA